jgi:hypothetical protein
MWRMQQRCLPCLLASSPGHPFVFLEAILNTKRCWSFRGRNPSFCRDGFDDMELWFDVQNTCGCWHHSTRIRPLMHKQRTPLVSSYQCYDIFLPKQSDSHELRARMSRGNIVKRQRVVDRSKYRIQPVLDLGVGLWILEPPSWDGDALRKGIQWLEV